MKRLLLALLLIALIAPVSARAEYSTVLNPSEVYRIPGCYIPNGKDVRFGTGFSYGATPVPLSAYNIASDGWTADYDLVLTNQQWHAHASSFHPDEGSTSGTKTLAWNDGPGTVVFFWDPASCV